MRITYYEMNLYGATNKESVPVFALGSYHAAGDGKYATWFGTKNKIIDSERRYEELRDAAIAEYWLILAVPEPLVSIYFSIGTKYKNIRPASIYTDGTGKFLNAVVGPDIRGVNGLEVVEYAKVDRDICFIRGHGYREEHLVTYFGKDPKVRNMRMSSPKGVVFFIDPSVKNEKSVPKKK
jgi:hypothetical protein